MRLLWWKNSQVSCCPRLGSPRKRSRVKNFNESNWSGKWSQYALKLQWEEKQGRKGSQWRVCWWALSGAQPNQGPLWDSVEHASALSYPKREESKVFILGTSIHQYFPSAPLAGWETRESAGGRKSLVSKGSEYQGSLLAFAHPEIKPTAKACVITKQCRREPERVMHYFMTSSLLSLPGCLLGDHGMPPRLHTIPL
jgi:hypothetical protein